MNDFPLIQAIFYAEFHPIQGPQVLWQVPEDFLNIGTPAAVTKLDSSHSILQSDSSQPNYSGFKLDFDGICDYIIPKRRLCNRLVCIKSGGYSILGNF